jgi:hypothetical protein
LSESPQEAALDNFVSRENIKRYRKLAGESTDTTARSRIMKLLAEEEAKLKLEVRLSQDPPEGPSPVDAATENQVEHDGRERRARG